MFMQAADEAAVAEAAERLAAQTEKELGSGAVVPPVRKKIACPWGGPPPHPHILLPMPHRPRLARCLVSMFSHSHCIPPSPPIQMQSLIVKHIPNELDLGAERGEKGGERAGEGKGGCGAARPGPVTSHAIILWNGGTSDGDGGNGRDEGNDDDDRLQALEFGHDEGADSGVEEIALQQSDILRSTVTWCDQVKDAIKSFQAYAESQTGGVGRDRPDGSLRHMSMVEKEVDGNKKIVFVHWQFPPIWRLGREVFIIDDEEGVPPKVKYPIPESPVEQFKGPIICPDVGMPVKKCKQHERPVLLPTMYRLREMWEVALAFPDFCEDDSGGVICEACGNLACVPKCPICLCVWHNNCAIQVLESQGKPDVFELRKRSCDEIALPPPFKEEGVLCALCASSFDVK